MVELLRQKFKKMSKSLHFSLLNKFSLKYVCFTLDAFLFGGYSWQYSGLIFLALSLGITPDISQDELGLAVCNARTVLNIISGPNEGTFVRCRDKVLKKLNLLKYFHNRQLCPLKKTKCKGGYIDYIE